VKPYSPEGRTPMTRFSKAVLSLVLCVTISQLTGCAMFDDYDDCECRKAEYLREVKLKPQDGEAIPR
jgi:hypothetical protein